MSYTESIIRDDESLIYRAKLHWIVIALPLAAVALVSLITRIGNNPDLIGLGMIWTGIALIWTASGIINYLNSEVVLTDQRIIAKAGVWKTKSVEIALPDLYDVETRVGSLGHKLGYGKVALIDRNREVHEFGPVQTPERFEVEAKAFRRRVIRQILFLLMMWNIYLTELRLREDR